MDELALSDAQRRLLLDQKIDMSQPGTVLSDFQMLLEAVRIEGFEAAGKHKLLPMAWIDDLDQRLSRPLRLELKRPQLRSHPYLQSLFLLLRASGLSRIDEIESKSRIMLDSEVLRCWNTLNPTEQYFTLLEAWIINGKAEMIGERAGMFREYLFSCVAAWQSIPNRALRGTRTIDCGVDRDAYLIALLDLFGLVDVTFPSKPMQPWWPAGLKHTAFGDSLMTLLAQEFLGDFHHADLTFPEITENETDDENGNLEPAQENETKVAITFGLWQPTIQPNFPKWRENLKIPAMERREGQFVFRVSLGKSVWRQIAIGAEATLEDLASWILKSVNFEEDHLYEFIIRNRFGAVEQIQHSYCEEGPFVTEIHVGELPLDVGQSMQFHFDFGDDWLFDVKLEDVLPSSKKAKTTRILKKHGKAPEQYPDCDDY